MNQWIVSLCCAAFLSVSAFAGPGNPAKAEALVKKAAEYVKANGKDAALKELNNPKGSFVDGDLYVFAFSIEDVCLAHAFTPGMVGGKMTTMVDPDGKAFFKEFHVVMAKSGSGWVDYRWTNPITKIIQPKSTFVMLLPEHSMYLGCGIYK